MASYDSSDADSLDARNTAFMRHQQSLPDESYASDTNSAAGADEDMMAQSEHPTGTASRLLKSVLGLPENERIGRNNREHGDGVPERGDMLISCPRPCSGCTSYIPGRPASRTPRGSCDHGLLRSRLQTSQ
jgi:hypothetical protein